MSVEGDHNTWLGMIAMGATWVVGAVASHVSIREKVKNVDKREIEHHDDAKEIIAAMDRRHTDAMEAMDRRHTDAMATFNGHINYIRKRIDKAIGGE